MFNQNLCQLEFLFDQYDFFSTLQHDINTNHVSFWSLSKFVPIKGGHLVCNHFSGWTVLDLTFFLPLASNFMVQESSQYNLFAVTLWPCTSMNLFVDNASQNILSAAFISLSSDLVGLIFCLMNQSSSLMSIHFHCDIPCLCGCGCCLHALSTLNNNFSFIRLRGKSSNSH